MLLTAVEPLAASSPLFALSAMSSQVLPLTSPLESLLPSPSPLALPAAVSEQEALVPPGVS
ncbi:MAG: hypothetical protein ABW171_00270 [Steroidobacter sp.]